MLHEGVIVRPLGSLIRVTVGLPEENERFAAALDHVIATGAEGVPV
jgi:histidinol-phosphate/aromatic aminotransferase/cobyric acid decarboxylase-like protein